MIRALDLYCGAGGATKGLQRAGFHVTGVDNRAQKRYCGDAFIQASVLGMCCEDLHDFDFVWASPPCQDSSPAARAAKKKGKVYPQLIPQTRRLLSQSGRPFVIENVPGAPLRGNVVRLCGTSFDLKVFRHRIFECSFPLLVPPCSHAGKRIGRGYFSVAGGSGRWSSWNGIEYGFSKGTIADWRGAMGIDWMTRAEIVEAIPPAYSEFIARAWLKQAA